MKREEDQNLQHTFNPCQNHWGQSTMIHFAFGQTQGKKLRGGHKIIRIPEETGGIQQKVGHHLVIKSSSPLGY